MKKFHLSLRDLLAIVAVFALLIALTISRIELQRMRTEMELLHAELDRVIPVREYEIKAQVEQQTADAGLPVTMTSSVYSGNSYLISFQYFHPISGNRTDSTFTLRYDGEGSHVGAIRDDSFLSERPDSDGERGLRIKVVDPLFAGIAAQQSSIKDVTD